MKSITRLSIRASALALVASLPFTSTGIAGGFDLTGQPIGIIFEEGNYIEFQVGTVIPEVKGSSATPVPPPFTQDFGNTANATPFGTGGAKFDITDKISAAVIYDQPYLRSTTYNRGLFQGTSADVSATTITAVGRYKFNENFSVYGGPRIQFASVDLTGPANLGPVTGFPPYAIDVKDEGFGFVVGAAAEIPEYKARVAITYNSEIDHSFDSVESFGPARVPGSFDIHTPQSVNLDVQAPVSESTLVRANIRWAEWGGVDFTPPFFAAQTGRPVVEYTEDTITYRLTVAQRFNEKLVGFVTGSYESDGGENISLFKTVDGGYSAGGGVIYDINDSLTLQLAGEYRWLTPTGGVQAPGAPPTVFDDDANAIVMSMKFGYRF